MAVFRKVKGQKKAVPITPGQRNKISSDQLNQNNLSIGPTDVRYKKSSIAKRNDKNTLLDKLNSLSEDLMGLEGLEKIDGKEKEKIEKSIDDIMKKLEIVEDQIALARIPDQISIEEFDASVGFSLPFESPESAKRFQQKHGGIIYTQVDMGNDRGYMKSPDRHFNKTGRYEVILK